MKITMIHGQNHKGSTYHIGRMLAEKLAAEADIEEFCEKAILLSKKHYGKNRPSN